MLDHTNADKAPSLKKEFFSRSAAEVAPDLNWLLPIYKNRRQTNRRNDY